ncbi:hypothetical protein ACFQMF_15585 [Halorubrum rutilum]|uniref:Uncharacterized protein n=1 Tax=Halorubrum rutilum TaxID=1364933 RepID=A0ABD6ANW2_9EURY
MACVGRPVEAPLVEIDGNIDERRKLALRLGDFEHSISDAIELVSDGVW